MTRFRPFALMALVLVTTSAGRARAQCAFQHPAKAAKFESSLVQAFVPCEEQYANSTAGGSIFACKPAETFAELSATYHAWIWGPGSRGKVSVKARTACTGAQQETPLAACSPADPLNAGPPAAADVDVSLRLVNVLEGPRGYNLPVDGVDGTLFLVWRLTTNGNAHGDATTVDFPASAPFHMTSGGTNLKTSGDAMLNVLGLSGLPPCTSLEVVVVSVIDSEHETFASAGIYLPVVP